MRFNKTSLNNCVKILEYYKYPKDILLPFMKKHNEELSHIQEELRGKVKRLEEKRLKNIALWE